MKPEDKARVGIDAKLAESGWVIQDMDDANLHAALGVAIREYPTSSGPVDYALFVEGNLVGVVEAKKREAGVNITRVEEQSARYMRSDFKWVDGSVCPRFAYEATDRLIRFTDYSDEKYRSRSVFSFYRPETLRYLMGMQDTVRNSLKRLPAFDTRGFRACQIAALKNLDVSFAENRPRALVQMATGAGKTFTAITEVYRLLKYGGMRRVLFLVDTRSLGEQAEREFHAYMPNDDPRSFAELYGVQRLKSSFISPDVQVCISTIQRMYSILKGEVLDESEENESLYGVGEEVPRSPKEVVYNEMYPPEFFDCIVVDECHRSIYNVWKQVLEYFDAFIIGLTATPDMRTIGFFNGNLVSEYSREQAIVDGVNVGEDVFLIETEVGLHGGTIGMQQFVEYRDRLSRERRWEELDEDLVYSAKQLDRDVVNPSQIRTVISAFRDALPTQLFPHRKEVPKTLIFAKTDSHADDLIQIVREVFGEGNEFCKKITYSAADPEGTLAAFRNDYYPRVAVTVDMIATGTDVKPIECLIFLRDVRSGKYFEQMLGRGTRTMGVDDLQKVTPSARENKDHFVVVDAVGVTRSAKRETRTLECKPHVSLRDLMMSVAFGAKDKETLTSLANRLVRLDRQLMEAERDEFVRVVGCSPRSVASRMLDAFDADVVFARARELAGSDTPDGSAVDAAREELIQASVEPFFRPEVREFVESVRRSHDQVIDSVNVDAVVFSGFDERREEGAAVVARSFEEFLREHADEIAALGIVYDQRYVDRVMAVEQMKGLYDQMMSQGLTIERVWESYGILYPEKVRRGVVAQLADLVSLVRFGMRVSGCLEPFAETVNRNFMQWTLAKNAGAVHFSEVQMEWLRLIRDHVASSLSIFPEDLELSPFDQLGGLGKFYAVFGDGYTALLDEMNEKLVA